MQKQKHKIVEKNLMQYGKDTGVIFIHIQSLILY